MARAWSLRYVYGSFICSAVPAIMPSLIVSDAVEPILAENPQRFCMFPIKYAEVWEMYKKAEASFWTGVTFSYSA